MYRHDNYDEISFLIETKDLKRYIIEEEILLKTHSSQLYEFLKKSI